MTRIAPTTVLTNSEIVQLAPAAGSTEPMSGVSARYTFVPTLGVIDMLRDAGWLPVHAEQSNVRIEKREGFQKHFIRFARPEFFLEKERIDLLLYNCHNRGGAFKILGGVWKFACGNGLVVGNEYANFSHRHIGFDADLFLNSAKQVADSAETIAAKIEDLRLIDLEPNEQGVYAMAAHKLLYGEDSDSAPIRPEQLLGIRRDEDKNNDLWTVFNKTQENIVKGGLKGSIIGDLGRRRKVTTRPVKSLDRNRELNQALWVLTEEMERLKLQQ